jgi:hypothetical protein
MVDDRRPASALEYPQQWLWHYFSFCFGSTGFCVSSPIRAAKGGRTGVGL